jgi:prepilin-type N-terminal cleavage/methylation domain-containing protein
VRANDAVPGKASGIFAGMRHGFTIIELLVAIVILTIGMLALAGTAGLVATHVGDGRQLTAGAHEARSVIDSLGMLECERVVSGSSARGGIIVSWSVSRDSIAATVAVAVGLPLRRRERRDVYQAVVPCTSP